MPIERGSRGFDSALSRYLEVNGLFPFHGPSERSSSAGWKKNLIGTAF
jgi:hypothetical protein